MITELYLYLEVLRTALDDDIVTDDEAQKVLAVALGIIPQRLAMHWMSLRGIDPSPISDTTLLRAPGWRCYYISVRISCST